jgi:hypothetical protein
LRRAFICFAPLRRTYWIQFAPGRNHHHCRTIITGVSGFDIGATSGNGFLAVTGTGCGSFPFEHAAIDNAPAKINVNNLNFFMFLFV